VTDKLGLGLYLTLPLTLHCAYAKWCTKTSQTFVQNKLKVNKKKIVKKNKYHNCGQFLIKKDKFVDVTVV